MPMQKTSVVILTALPVEYKAVRQHLASLKEDVHSKGTIYETGVFTTPFQSWKVGIVEIGAGNEGAAMEAERAISHFAPEVSFFVGVAGGVKDVKIGDVVVATRVYGYESGAAKRVFEPRPSVAEAAYSLVQRARAEAKKEDWLERLKGNRTGPAPRVLVGPIAAGEKVVKSTRAEVYKFLKQNYGDALAVEMEGRGFLKAAHANAANAIIVRGISDLINNKGRSDASGSQEIASDNAAAFTFEMLAKLTLNNAVHPSRKGENTGHNISNDEIWENLIEVVINLYPRGPEDQKIWLRSGGDVSAIELNSSGKASWVSALLTLKKGGGGKTITLIKLVQTMREDYPNNAELERLFNSIS